MSDLLDLSPQEAFIEAAIDPWAGCEKCEDLAPRRNRQVFGIGNPTADIFVIGTAPGGAEDKKGVPFDKTADAGRVYHELLAGVKLVMGDVFTANMVACRPYMSIQNHRTGYTYDEQRDPTKVERDNCRPLWEELIYRVDPLIIVTLGALAAEELTGLRALKITKIRGELMSCSIKGRAGPVRYPLMPMFQPAFLSRSQDRAQGGPWWKTQRDWQRVIYVVDRLKQMYFGIQPPERGIKKEDIFTGGGGS